MLTVELRPHKGMMQTELGPVEVTHPQYLVIVTREEITRHVGYVGTQPNAPFNGLDAFTSLPQVLKDEIVAEVNKQLGGMRSVHEQPIGAWPDDDEADHQDDDTDVVEEE